MPVHEDARNTKRRCDEKLIIGITSGEKAHQAMFAQGAANVYARLRNKSRQFGRNPPTWPLRRASDFERCRHSQDPVRLQSGAGSRPCVLRMLPIVVSQMLSPTFDSAPLIRSYPHVGFSFTNWAVRATVRSTVTCRLWSPVFFFCDPGHPVDWAPADDASAETMPVQRRQRERTRCRSRSAAFDRGSLRSQRCFGADPRSAGSACGRIARSGQPVVFRDTQVTAVALDTTRR